MAQTKKKRRTKHRGNAAGVIEARGRTGRPPTEAERRAAARAQVRANRFDQPPSWRSAANRAAVAALIFGLAVVLLFGQDPSQGIALAGLMLVIYIPMTYLTDSFIYNRRQRKKAEAQAKGGG